MEYLALLALVGVGFAFSGFGSENIDDGDETPEEPEDPVITDEFPEDPVVTDINAFLVADGEVTEGTDDADLFTFAANPEPLLETTIRGGAGDDLVYLDTGSELISITDSEISGGDGDGDDLIRFNAQYSTITGGNGDDTIEGAIFIGGNVSGDAGNDQITVAQGGNEALLVDGGSGDDTIDALDLGSGRVSGNDGDDLIMTAGSVFSFTGNYLASDGGAGDDTLVHEVASLPLSTLGTLVTDPAVLTGGEGADTFEVRIGSGGGFGQFIPSEFDPDVFQQFGAAIADYEKGIDVITIGLFEGSSSYGAVEARLEENTSAGLTNLIVLLQSDGLPDQEVITRIDTIGLTWDDINFVGRDASTVVLVPI